MPGIDPGRLSMHSRDSMSLVYDTRLYTFHFAIVINLLNMQSYEYAILKEKEPYSTATTLEGYI